MNTRIISVRLWKSWAPVAVVLALACVCATPALAQGSKVSSSIELGHRAATLEPGQWVWASSIAPAGPVLVYVDLSRQRATVYRNGIRIGVSTISSGKAGHATPTGVFTILQKAAKHHSSKYNNAPMPFTQRLTWDGVALHAGGLPGYPESHGCVHLPYGFSKELFAITTLGATVVVAGNASKPVPTAEGSLLAPLDATGKEVFEGHLKGAEYRWTPENSPTGPMTIILSKRDQRVVVLRDGIQIGRALAEIHDEDPGTHVLSLAAIENGKPRWIYVGIPGHEEDAGRELEQAIADRVRLPRPFYDAVMQQLRPGDTVVVTQSSVGAETGEKITILDSVSPGS